MTSESILLSMNLQDKERARSFAAGIDLEGCLDGCDCHGMSGLQLVAIINDRVLPRLNLTADGQRIVTGLGDFGNILRDINIEELAKSFGVAAVGVVREKILPKIREANGTAALIVSNLLELVEGKLRA